MTIVTALSHPVLFGVLEVLSHDVGAGAGHSNYAIPSPWTEERLAVVERQLQPMSAEERETFAIGEDNDSRGICAKFQAFEEI